MKLLPLFLGLFLSASSQAGAPGSRIEDVDLASLLDGETDVATAVPLSPRELPGVVTIVKRDEILRSGARDLMEILERVPGLQSNVDVQSVVGLSVRGQWGADGRYLVLLDGVPLSEPLYGSTKLGGRIPADVIQRVEVLRGAAGARYGGGASAAVINVVTTRADDGGSTSAGLAVCARSTGLGCAFANTQVVHQRDGLRIAVGAHGGRAHLFQGDAEDFEGTKADVGRLDHSDPLMLRVDVRTRRSTVQAGVEAVGGRQIDSAWEFRDEATVSRFDQVWVHGETELPAAGRWQLVPFVRLQGWRPWQGDPDEDSDSYDFYDRSIGRSEAGFSAHADLSPRTRIDAGAGGFLDLLRSGPRWEEWPMPPGDSRSRLFATGYAHAEVMRVGERANALAGLRVEVPTELGVRVIPRVALTSASEVLHGKILLSGFTRSPTYEQHFVQDSVAPERGAELEVEGGVRFSSHLQLRANAFANTTVDPIRYKVVDDDDYYFNGPTLGNLGVETDLTWRSRGLEADLLSAWARRYGPLDPHTQVADRPHHSVGVAPFTINAMLRGQAARGVWLGAALLTRGPRVAFTGASDEYELLHGDLPATAQLNLTARVEDIRQSGVSVGLTVNDVFDSGPDYVQAYAGWHPEMPARGRELMLTVEWRRR